MKNIILASILALSVIATARAEAPAGYFNKCEGKTGEALLTALYNTIGYPQNTSYDGLWEVYRTSDIDENGFLWDMYSTKRWTPGKNECGNYKQVGDCVNREHSFPKSWFSERSPMKADAYHVYPTDGKVNGQRSNYPYGECADGTTLPSNGGIDALGRLGTCTFPGYSGKVFEPVDQYKGDFARTYFYMIACYNNAIKSWNSDMLDGSTYPGFTSWAINLLLKWSRNDEVSQKEIDRNEAVAAVQENRNPFIDHPELAEYIWGNKVGTPWYSDATLDPQLNQPSADHPINLGYAGIGVSRSITTTVKGVSLTAGITLSTSGYGYSVSPTTLTAAQVNSGATITISLLSNHEGTCEGVLSLRSSQVNCDVDLTAEVVSDLPILNPSNISPTAMDIRWVNIDGAGATYTLHLKQGSQYVPGYPLQVAAADELYHITDLEPETTYSIYLTSASMQSRVVTATTPELEPEISLLFDGKLHFDADPNQPSDEAELLLDIENVNANFTVMVDEPFEVSSDKSSWTQTLVLSPSEERFYLRVGPTEIGNYETSIKLIYEDYCNDSHSASATVVDGAAFVERWETVAIGSLGSYTKKTFKGDACSWTTNNGGFWSSDKSYSGDNIIRMGNNNDSYLEMAEDKAKGLGTLTFEACKWTGDADPTIDVEFSTDGGTTWTSAGTITLAEKPLQTYNFNINRTGSGRIRLRQTAGKRWLVDNLSISDYTSMLEVMQLDYHSWDTWCRDSQLIISSNREQDIMVVSIDGTVLFDSHVAIGETAIDLAPGLYIVASDGFSRRVLVK